LHQTRKYGPEQTKTINCVSFKGDNNLFLEEGPKVNQQRNGVLPLTSGVEYNCHLNMTKWCNKHSCTGPLSDEQQHATSQTVFSLSPHPLEQLAFLPDRTNGQWQGYDKTIHGHGLENTKS